jgi:hypothetical protein
MQTEPKVSWERFYPSVNAAETHAPTAADKRCQALLGNAAATWSARRAPMPKVTDGIVLADPGDHVVPAA